MTAVALFDWRSSDHWSSKAEPCGVCERPTQLRSDRGKPAHKVCAEQWADQHPKPEQSER